MPADEHPRPHRWGPADHGQAMVLVMGLVAALLVVVAVAIAAVGRTSADRTRAQTAADAAALASVVGDRSDAAEYAEAHGALLVSWVRVADSGDVVVRVRIGDVVASARASTQP